MAENEDGQEKKHDPGAKKWEDAAEKGQIPKSQDIGSTAVLVVGVLVLVNGSGPMLQAVRRSLVNSYKGLTDTHLDLLSAQELLWSTAGDVAIALAAPLLAIALAATLANLAQTGMQMAPKALEPDINRLNALSNFKQQYLSATPAVELLKGLGKVLMVSAGATVGVYSELDVLPTLSLVAVEEMPILFAQLVVRMLLGALPVMLVIAAGDYGYSLYKMTENLKRTDKEVKDDQKETDGDPHMKARRKQLARQMLFSGSIQAVTEADVVITNPTHFAVALRYKRGRDVAPIVVAKGVDAGAARIREAAREARVPMVENRTLARSLWKIAKVDKTIPEEFYAPVARVLAIVWARKRKTIKRTPR